MLRLGWSLIGIFSSLLIIVVFNFFNIFSIVTLGAIGLFFYPICIFFIFVGVMKVINKPIKANKPISILLFLWVVVFILIMQMLTSKSIDESFAKYTLVTFKENITAGGVIFGTILYPIYYLTHNVATYVILACLLVLISALLIDKIRLFIIARNTFAVNDINSSEVESNIDVDEENIDQEKLSANYSVQKNELIDDDIFIDDEDEDPQQIAKRKLGLIKEERTIEDLNNIVQQSEEDNTENNFVNTLDTRTNTNKPNIIVHEDAFNLNSNKFAYNTNPQQLENIKTEQQLKEEEKKRAALEFLNISRGKFQSKDHSRGIDNVQDNSQVPTTTTESLNNIQNNTPINNYNPSNENTHIYNDNNSVQNDLVQKAPINNYNNDIFDNNLTKKSFENDIMNNSTAQSISIPAHLQSQSNFIPKKAQEIYSADVKDNIVEPTIVGHVQVHMDDPNVSRVIPKPKQPKPYVKPPISLLTKYESKVNKDDEMLNINAQNIVTTLKNFKIDTKVLNIIQGPTFTLYEMQMLPGISVSLINSKIQDLEMVLRNKIRLQIPIPGKNAFGIEVPNQTRATVSLRDIIESKEFQSSTSPLTIALGKDISNTCKIAQIDKLVHTLVAGGTNSGKSVCLHTLLISLLYKASPDELKLLLVDPKMVEFPLYNDIPHMLIPKAITDIDKAIQALDWLVIEMQRRYQLLQNLGARNIIAYNEKPQVKSGAIPKMYYIVMVFDEVGEFMTQKKKEIEDAIKRLAAMARACGIHLILTTQRPSTDVITGIIKTNLPSRIAFTVTQYVDSKTILDASGAESLLGKGDMLFLPQGAKDPERMQCAFADDQSIENILNFIKENNEADFDESIEDEMFNKKESFDTSNPSEEIFDPLLKDCLKQFIRTKKVASGFLQGYFSIGYPRANKIVLQMEKAGFVSPPDAKSRRSLYMTAQEFEERFGESIE